MKKTLSLCLALLPVVCSAAGHASEISEGAAAFRSLSEFKPVFVSKPVRQTRMSRVVTLTGNIDLSGNVYVSNDNGYVNVNLHGWADVWDSTGKIRSGSTAVDYNGWINVSNGWINEQISPSYDIEVFSDGRNVGLAHVSGYLFLTGHVSGRFVYLSVRNTLSGTVEAQEP